MLEMKQHGEQKILHKYLYFNVSPCYFYWLVKEATTKQPPAWFIFLLFFYKTSRNRDHPKFKVKQRESRICLASFVDNASHKVEGYKFKNITDFPIQSCSHKKLTAQGFLKFNDIVQPKRRGTKRGTNQLDSILLRRTKSFLGNFFFIKRNFYL